MSQDNPVYIISDHPEKLQASFNFEEDAGTLARLIANKQNKTPLVIGIYGPWGSGKTTLMETIRRQLADSSAWDKSTFRTCKTVWFQAWKYKNEDEILAALLETVLSAMKQDGFLGWLKGQSEEFIKRLNLPGVIKELSKLLGKEIDLNQFFDELPYRGKLGFYDTFRDFFQCLVWDYLNWRPQVKASEMTKDEKGALVVFIDDLDRCPPTKIVLVLETIKLFMDMQGCVFVIGAAEEIIAKALEENYKDDARRFMEKIVQVSFHLPRVTEKQFEPYLGELHSEIGPALQPHLKLVLPALDCNTRRLKGFINSLSLRQGILQGRNMSLNLDLLVPWTILEQVFPDFINDVKRNGSQILLALREKAQSLKVDDQAWGPDEKLIQEVQPSLRDYFKNRELIRVLMQFNAAKEQIEELITLSQVAKIEEKSKPTQSRIDFGAMSKEIPVGAFIYGDGARKPNAKIEKPYQIGIYPVTNQEFDAFMRAGGYKKDEFWTNPAGKAWRDKENITQPALWDDPKWNQPDHPVVGVSFYEAEAFCQWMTLVKNDRFTYYLPTEQEWERAARGTDGRVYPWGNEFDTDKCNTKESGIGQTTPVTKYPNGTSPEGCYDMAGNVWEWTSSSYDEKEKNYVLRGGSWDLSHEFARCAVRNGGTPEGRLRVIGFRCVRTSG